MRWDFLSRGYEGEARFGRIVDGEGRDGMGMGWGDGWVGGGWDGWFGWIALVGESVRMEDGE